MVPSTIAVPMAGKITPSSESGSPEQWMYTLSSPRSSIAAVVRRIKVDFPQPGLPLRMIRS